MLSTLRTFWGHAEKAAGGSADARMSSSGFNVLSEGVGCTAPGFSRSVESGSVAAASGALSRRSGAAGRRGWAGLMLATGLLAGVSFTACSSKDSSSEGAGGENNASTTDGGASTAGGATRTLTLGAYTTPREAYGKDVLPAFQKYWKDKTGQNVKFEESYQGSGAQARAIVGGFEADVAALSLEADIEKLVDARLITHDWKAGPTQGMVSRSVVVLAVRPGNPKGIKGWDDLTRAGVQVLTPNVKTSGGAMWNVAAVYGAAMRGHTASAKDDVAGAEGLLRNMLKNVTIMDKGARESMVTFERGVGDVAITYENEVMVGKQAGQKYDYVVPSSSILIENPIAVVDVYADKHKNRDIAEAFVQFAITAEAQRLFARYGLRPVDEAVGKEVAGNFPTVTDLFTIRDLGGWPAVQKSLFAEGGVYSRALPAGNATSSGASAAGGK